MIRQHITILETQPNGDLLREHLSKAGFRVFYEKHTNLYYLDSHDRNNPKLPSFGSGMGYETVLNHKNHYNIPQLDHFLREQVKAKAISKGQFNADAIQDCLFLSAKFQTRAFCAYHDDEDIDFVVIANQGALEKLCFSAISRARHDMEPEHFEVVYHPGEEPKLEKEQNEFNGHNSIYQREFLSTFGKSAPDLFFFGQTKPIRDNLKSEAKALNISQAALLRSYGQFKLVDFEQGQTNPLIEKFYKFLDMALKIILIPFVLIVVLVISIRDDIKHSKK